MSFTIPPYVGMTIILQFQQGWEACVIWSIFVTFSIAGFRFFCLVEIFLKFQVVMPITISMLSYPNGVGMFLQSIGPSFSFPKFNLQGFVKPHFQVHIREQEEQVQRSGSEIDMAPLKVVGAEVLSRLEKVLKTEGIDLRGLAESDFTPEKIAERIMSSVQAAFGRFRQAQPESDVGRFFSEVREGLEKGFSEARDVLQGVGALQGKIAGDVDKIQDLTMQGLDDLASQNTPSTQDDSAVDSRIDSTMAFQSLAMQQSRSAEIQVKTREGDVVTISFSQSSSSSRSALQVQQGDSSMQAFQESDSENSGFSISIEGNLNRDEQKSLQKLMKKMHKVSNAFFHGNGKAALKHALKLGFNDQQIAGFSMDLSMQKSVQAVAAYQQTSVPQQNVQPDLLAQAGDFLSRAKTMLADAESVLQALAEPRQSFNDLFSGIGSLTGQNSAGADDPVDQALYSSIVDQIGRNAFVGEAREAA